MCGWKGLEENEQATGVGEEGVSSSRVQREEEGVGGSRSECC